MCKTQRSFLEQISLALSRPYLGDRCKDLSRILPLANSSKELSTAFTLICADIFGYAAGGGAGFGWNLTELSKNNYLSSRDYTTVFTFLSKNGPLLDAIHRLLPDPANVYEYPLTQLPSVALLRNSLQNQYGGTVTLSSFEYYFYHFFNLPIRTQLHSQGYNNNAAPQLDTIYPVLLEDYLNFFVPIDPIQQAQLFLHQSQSDSAPIVTGTQNNQQSSGQNRSSLFRRGFSPTRVQHTEPVINQGMSQPNTRETWRLDTIIRIISNFWLEPFACEHIKTLENAVSSRMSGATDESFVTASLRIAASLPTVDLMRCIRLFVKHAHYFTNACRMGTLYLPGSLKINIFGDHIATDTMLHFFKHTIGHWPLDSSFRHILETWLSYIQPWRYSYDSKGIVANENIHHSMDQPEQWISFLRENFSAYNNLLGQVIVRFYRQDLSSSKNAFSVYRVFRVFTQDNLLPTLRSVSSLVVIGMTSSPSRSFHSSHQSLSYPAWDVNTSDTEFQNIFAPEFKTLMSQFLVKILETKFNEQEYLKNRKLQAGELSAKEKSDDLLSKIFKLVFGKPKSDSGEEIELGERAKTLQNLEFAIEKIANVFQLSGIVTEYSERFIEDHEKNFGSDVTSASDCDISCVDGVTYGLSPTQRYDLIYKKKKPEIRYTGHPDLPPIRSDELPCLVRSLHSLSQWINNRFEDEISDFYQRASPAGSLVRQICEPPTSYIEKVAFGERQVVHLPARIVLRPLASYRYLFYLFLFFAVSILIFGNSILGSLFWLFIGYAVLSTVRAVLSKPIQDSSSIDKKNN